VANASGHANLRSSVGFFLLVEAGFGCSIIVKSDGWHVPFSPYCVIEFRAKSWLAGTSAAILVFDAIVAGLTICVSRCLAAKLSADLARRQAHRVQQDESAALRQGRQHPRPLASDLQAGLALCVRRCFDDLC
jgi:hypothetical protein